MDLNPDPNVYLSEEQQFRQPWLMVAITAGCIASILGFWFAIVSLSRGSSAPNLGVFILAAEALAMGLFMALLLSTKMITEVRWDGLLVRAYPLNRLRRFIPYGEIASCEARTYSPIREYGGWGIKYGRGGRAYNISGDQGVQLVMKSGERLLIGSQKADELAAAIRERMR